MRSRSLAATCALVPPLRMPPAEPIAGPLRYKVHGVEVEAPWHVHRPGEMDPFEAAALRAASLRSVMRGER